MALPDIFNDPVLFAALTLAVLAVLQYQRTLSWPEYRRIHALKVRFLPIIDRYTNLFVISRKGTPTEDAEYLTTVSGSVGDVFKRLVAGGGSPHLINSVKVRPHGDGSQYSAAHVVWTHDSGDQTEAYLFRAEHGVDVYSHFEPSVVNVDAHLSGEQTDGDPRGVVRAALDG